MTGGPNPYVPSWNVQQLPNLQSNNGGGVFSNTTVAAVEAAAVATAAASAAATYVPLAGGTMTGVLNTVGVDTAASAPILTSVAGSTTVGTQLSDHTRDYMVHLQFSTGTALTVSMGHTSGANDITIVSNAAAASGEVVSFKLPAGWFFQWTETTGACIASVAIGC